MKIILAFLMALSLQAAVTINVTNTSWYFSPYVTYSDGGGAMGSNNVKASSTFVLWNNPGAYFKCVFTGTSFVLNVTESQIGGAGGYITWSTDSGAWQSHQLDGSETTITLATALVSGNHTLLVYLKNWNFGQNRYTGSTPAGSLIINSATLDTSAQLNAPSGVVAVLTKNCYIAGDSITEGVYADAQTNPAGGNSTSDWGRNVAAAFACEYGNNAWTGTGWSATGASGPAFTTSSGTWSNYFASKTRLITGKLSPVPDYVFVNHGYNDSTSNITAAVTTWVGDMRAAVNSTTPVFIIIPFAGTERSNITNGVTNAADSYAVTVDLGSVAQYGLAGSASNTSTDGIHPWAATHGLLGAMVSKLSVLASGGGGSVVLNSIFH